MTDFSQPFAFAPYEAPRRRPRRALRRAAGRVLPGAGILALTLFMGALYVQPPLPSFTALFARVSGADTPARTVAPVAQAEAAAQPAEDPAQAYGALVDPRKFALSVTKDTPPVVASLQARLEPAAPAEETELVDPPFPPPSPLRLAETPDEGADAPLPAPRPRELAALPKTEAAPAPVVPAPSRRMARQESRPALAPGAPIDSSSIFDKLFAGLKSFGQQQQQRGQALAYAAPDGGVMNDAARLSPRIPSAVTPGVDRQTAVYDISARTVYMPDGTRLEAHSGLGDKMDDPRHVHVSMRGPTPPDVYELSLREQLFHGVQALRLTPIGGGRQYGRNGFLAHTYMLGPSGASNGCVSFRNYAAFLRAFQMGQIRRLIVVSRL
ncbi:DUF2778 domain-containing protein [Methylocella sp.]|uniref:DUF2778 domain-containing protein n=1 Tax=Methylocella sp. TaxID=1978226 RepID=UPI0037831E21